MGAASFRLALVAAAASMALTGMPSFASPPTELGTADAFYVAPHRNHGAACLEADVLLDPFSPARANFLEQEH